MPSPTEAWVALRAAMLDAEPACKGDPRFTADDSDPEPLARICARCPLIEPCSALANMDQPIPIWGFVGGRVRRGNRSTGLVTPRVQDRRLFA